MTRKTKPLLTLLLALTLVAGLGAGAVLLLHHVPHFYRNAEISPGKDRVKLSDECYQQGTKFIALLAADNDPWSVQFTQAEINSFFVEDFVKSSMCVEDAKSLERQGISDPRISIEKDRLRLAFRYTNTFISTVVSLDLKIWLVPKETNVFAIEILGRYAGAMPISSQTIQDQIANLARKYNLEASWYRHDGHPVALLHVRSTESRPASKFLRLELQPGQLIIGGVSLVPANAQNKKALEPVGN